MRSPAEDGKAQYPRPSRKTCRGRLAIDFFRVEEKSLRIALGLDKY